jgi:hypothetical protein
VSTANRCRILALAILCFLVGDLSAAAAPRPSPQQQTPCNNSAQNSPAAQQRRCSQTVFNRLYGQVGKYCKQAPRSCNRQTDTCSSLSAKISAGYGCTDARELVQQQCYRPGDPGYQGHMAQISEANAALRNCKAIQDDKCP